MYIFIDVGYDAAYVAGHDSKISEIVVVEGCGG